MCKYAYAYAQKHEYINVQLQWMFVSSTYRSPRRQLTMVMSNDGERLSFLTLLWK